DVVLTQPGEVDVVHQLLVVDDDSRGRVDSHRARTGVARLPSRGEAGAAGITGAGDPGRSHPAVEGVLGVAGVAGLAVLPLAAVLGEVWEPRGGHAVARATCGLGHDLASRGRLVHAEGDGHLGVDGVADAAGGPCPVEPDGVVPR